MELIVYPCCNGFTINHLQLTLNTFVIVCSRPLTMKTIARLNDSTLKLSCVAMLVCLLIGTTESSKCILMSLEWDYLYFSFINPYRFGESLLQVFWFWRIKCHQKFVHDLSHYGSPSADGVSSRKNSIDHKSLMKMWTEKTVCTIACNSSEKMIKHIHKHASSSDIRDHNWSQLLLINFKYIWQDYSG